MVSYGVPREALRTPCIDGCPSTVLWEYDDGEPPSYWHPGTPDWFEAVAGCSDDHLDLVSLYPERESRLGELYRQLEQYLMACDSGRLNAVNSRRYLLGRPDITPLPEEDLYL